MILYSQKGYWHSHPWGIKTSQTPLIYLTDEHWIFLILHNIWKIWGTFFYLSTHFTWFCHMILYLQKRYWLTAQCTVFIENCNQSLLLSTAKQGDNALGCIRLSVCYHSHAAVDVRGSALPSAAKRNNHHYQAKVIVCVSVISRHMRIIARMRSITFYLCF